MITPSTNFNELLHSADWKVNEKLIYSIVNSSFIICGLPGKAHGEIPKECNFLYESFFLIEIWVIIVKVLFKTHILDKNRSYLGVYVQQSVNVCAKITREFFGFVLAYDLAQFAITSALREIKWY